jgi:hypothetical protein
VLMLVGQHLARHRNHYVDDDDEDEYAS